MTTPRSLSTAQRCTPDQVPPSADSSTNAADFAASAPDSDPTTIGGGSEMLDDSMHARSRGAVAGRLSQHHVLTAASADYSREGEVRLNAAQCEKYRETTGCSWRKLWSCPGEPRGSLGVVTSL